MFSILIVLIRYDCINLAMVPVSHGLSCIVCTSANVTACGDPYSGGTTYSISGYSACGVSDTEFTEVHIHFFADKTFRNSCIHQHLVELQQEL